MRYVALYCRLSPKRDGSGCYEGVDLQESWGRDYAARTWPDLPVRVFADRGLSGADDDRPGFEALRKAIADGQVAHVWCVEQSRIARNETLWFTFAAELTAAGITQLHTSRDGVIRVGDEIAGIKAVLAAAERRRMLQRQADTFAEQAARGIPPGSRPYGYRHARTEDGVRTYEIVPEQAEIIRECADRILSGWSLARIAKDLTDRGIAGPRGAVLTPNTIKGFVTNPSVVADRVHQGKVVGRGNWQPILDRDTYEAVRHKLASPRLVQRADGGVYPITKAGTRTARKYLLYGFSYCAVCKHPLSAGLKQLRSTSTVRSVPYYTCAPKMGGKACVGVMAEPFEDYVVDALWRELDHPGFLQALAEDEREVDRRRVRDGLASLARRRQQLADLWASGEITAEEWQAARRRLDLEEDKLRTELASIPPPVANVDIHQARRAWPKLTLDEQREFLGLFIDRILLDRASRKGKKFEPSRVSIEWRRA